MRPTGAGRWAAPRLRCRRVDGPPLAAVRVWLPGGSRAEEVPGTALVTGRALAEGSRRHPWRALVAETEGRGIELTGFGGYEVAGLAVDCLAAELDRALDWAAELTLEPAFAAERVTWLTDQAAAELAGLADQPEVRVGWAFREQLYHPHPRARPLQGSAESLARIDAAACRAFHRRSLRRGPIVAVSGQLEERVVTRRLERLFGAVECGGDAPPPALPAGHPDRRREIELAGVDQAHLLAGHLTLPRNHPDFAALELLGVVLGAGAGLSGRFPERLREKEGLAYLAMAEAVAGAGLEPGRFEVYLATSPRRVGRAEKALREELIRLLDGGLRAAEFEAARGYLLGSDPFRSETARQWADLLGAAELYGIPLDDPGWRRRQWRDLDRRRVEEAARRHLRPDDLRLTLGVPARSLAPAASLG